MQQMEDTESGYIGEINLSENFGNRITDVEILSESQTNVVACGRRHGRLWLLKGLSPELRDTTSGRRRLMKEFEVHSRLCHPSVVQAVDVEEVDGIGQCIVMEWVEGDTLSDLLREGKLSKHERRRIMRDIVVAVEYIHRNGVVHRDLKPANIMVRRAGHEVVIIDFGLADTDNYVELKQSAGTQGFISPEQLEKGGADTSDDVYSLGVIMNELCPQYRKLTRLCTGPQSARPADAGALRTLMDSRSRRRKTIAWAISLAAFLLLAAFGYWRITALEQSARLSAQQSEERVNALMLENQRNADNATRLSDSLTRVYSRMHEAELELEQTKNYSKLYDDNFRNGCNAIDRVFNQFEKKYFSSNNTPDALDFDQSVQTLNQEQQQLIDRLQQLALKSGLKENDALRLKDELNNHFLYELEKRYNEWIKKMFPTTI